MRNDIQSKDVTVVMTRGYWLGKYEVTQAEWMRVKQTEPWKGVLWTKGGDDFPATCITWEGAMDFTRRLTQEERRAGRLADGWEYTLPTEAQWEHACRARSESTFGFGDDPLKLGEYAWFATSVADQFYAHRVGQKKPNSWGLHDMHGNAIEWCLDSWEPEWPSGRDPAVISKDRLKVIRGGAWDCPIEKCHSAARDMLTLREDSYVTGFRVALSPVRPVK